ncbi:DUF1905 domain-containing protein [Sphingomonas sp. 7/4-4]|uniref:DUF1905 domain-containing protein n=1 Tax=Sphingomonas sp. 7/4-4 TaxID=3018446 RepID=UPI0022F3B8DB|nr:DUF1905 domain-containing protein [Sphingomonas sp. 7/4-4]WBY06711.1 DUF1905 domain-containing protein [Sphingomonas sp. 7/4-4]
MTDDAPLVLETELWRWTPEPPAKASWYFVTIVGEAADAIRARAFELRAMGGARGFGSVRVRASVDGVAFDSSVFPHKESGGYLLPVKAEVRRKAGVGEGIWWKWGSGSSGVEGGALSRHPASCRDCPRRCPRRRDAGRWCRARSGRGTRKRPRRR